MARKTDAIQTKSSGRFLAKNEEIHPFLAFQEEMNRLFDSFFHGPSIDIFERKPVSFSPKVDITDTGSEIKVSAELPGLEDKDIEVTLTKDTLTIKGEKKEEKEDKGKSYHRMERSYGSFVRTIPLPVDVQTEKVGAKFKKGVLTVTLPKAEKVLKETKKIQIKSE